MKYIQSLSVMGVILSLFCHQVSAADVTVIDVIDTKTLNFSLSEDVQLKQGIVNGEIQVLQDIVIDSATPDSDNPKVVTISLTTPLQPETDYSILTVFGADGTIDFTTPSSIISGKEIINDTILQSEQAIEKVTLLSDMSLKIQYNSDILDTENLEYKVLGTLPIQTMEKKDIDGNGVYISLKWDLYPAQDYLLMVISLLDINGAEVNIDNGIYDFTTPDVLESFENLGVVDDIVPMDDNNATDEAKLSIQEKIAARNASQEEPDDITGLGGIPPVDENTLEGQTQQEDELAAGEEDNIELNSAGEEGKFVNTLIDEASETPETGAETWILLLITLIINSFYYFTRVKTQA